MFSGGDDSTQAPQDGVAVVDPAMPADNSTGTTDASQPASAPAAAAIAPEAAELPIVSPPAAPAAGMIDANDLLNIKQQALQQLSPLLGHLDQPPEERFRTTMMMIQASDNSSLLRTAYEAAQQITDEKSRAQALLDVVNEINYFTQQNDGEPEPAAA